MGMLNAIFAPLIVLYMIMYSFFRYFDVRIAFEAQGKLYLSFRVGISR